MESLEHVEKTLISVVLMLKLFQLTLHLSKVFDAIGNILYVKSCQSKLLKRKLSI